MDKQDRYMDERMDGWEERETDERVNAETDRRIAASMDEQLDRWANKYTGEISGSHGDEYKDCCHLGCCVVVAW
jgi:hypothetical protein